MGPTCPRARLGQSLWHFRWRLEVEEAVELVRSTFGEVYKLRASQVRLIAADLFHHAAKPPSEDQRQRAVIRSQELSFRGFLGVAFKHQSLRNHLFLECIN